MSKHREPIDLIIAKGKKHLTKDEEAERRVQEIKAPSNAVVAPRYLTKTQRARFDDIARQLVRIGIMSNLDCDTLARYLQSHDNYLKYHRMVGRVLRQCSGLAEMEDNADLLSSYENLRDKALRQCRGCAGDLGLTITSRCRLVIPQAPPPPKENKFAKNYG